MLKLINEIILSNNVVERFYNEYNNSQEFRNWLDKEIPEIKLCEAQQQNNPWHKYNVLGHILHSVEEMNKQTFGMDERERRILAYTMLFHDIGKPEKHITREKDGKIIDSFFNHNVASDRIAKEHLPKLGFNKKEVDIITKLVYKHDIFMFIKDKKTKNPHWKVLTEELVKDEIEDLSSVGDGLKLMHWLVMVGRADNLSQNEKMTAEALALLDKFDSIINKFEQSKSI
ncbi:MAG: HD domain-containing protein [Clostridia bacterium]|nr:HD domain-containing protein [Clostridia bacterium]